MDYVELAISSSELATGLMVPVLWDSSFKLGTHYGPLKYFQKNVKFKKITNHEVIKRLWKLIV